MGSVRASGRGMVPPLYGLQTLDPGGIDAKEFWRQYPNMLSKMGQQAVAPFELPVLPPPKKPCRYPNGSRAADVSADQLLQPQQPPCLPPRQPAALSQQAVFDSVLPSPSKGPLPEHDSPWRHWDFASAPPLLPHPVASTSSGSPPAASLEEPFPDSSLYEFSVSQPPSASLASCGPFESHSGNTECLVATNAAGAVADGALTWRCGALPNAAESLRPRIPTNCEPGGRAPGGQLSRRGPSAAKQQLADPFSGPWGTVEQPLVAGSLPCSSDDGSLWEFPPAGGVEWGGATSDDTLWLSAEALGSGSSGLEGDAPAGDGLMPGPDVRGGGDSWSDPSGDDALPESLPSVSGAAGLPRPIALAPEWEGGPAGSQGGEAAAEARELGGAAAASEGVTRACSRRRQEPSGAASPSPPITCSPSVISSAATQGTEEACSHAGSSSDRTTDDFAERLGALLDFDQNLSAWDLAPDFAPRSEGGLLLPSPLALAAPEAAWQRSAGGDEGGALALAAATAARQPPAGSPRERALRPGGSSQAQALLGAPGVLDLRATAVDRCANVGLEGVTDGGPGPAVRSGKRPLLVRPMQATGGGRPPDITARLALLVQSRPPARDPSEPFCLPPMALSPVSAQLAAATSAVAEQLRLEVLAGVFSPSEFDKETPCGSALWRTLSRREASNADALEQRHLAIVAGAGAAALRQVTLGQLLEQGKGGGAAADSQRSGRWLGKSQAKFSSESFEARRQSSGKLSFVVLSATGGSLSHSSQRALKQRLLALAEASAANHHAHVGVLTERLKREADPMGDVMQRIVHYTVDALQVRARGLGAYRYALPPVCSHEAFADALDDFTVHLPFLQFGMTAMAHVCTARLRGFSRIHIIDYEVWEGAQWPPFLRQLCRGGGRPRSVRVTALRGASRKFQMAKPGPSVASLINGVFASLALELSVELEYRQVALDVQNISRRALGIADDEGVAVCTAIKLQQMSDGPQEPLGMMSPRDMFLRGMRAMRPAVLTVAEIDCDLSAPEFLPRFRAALEFYICEFASHDSAFPRSSQRRLIFERDIMARDLVAALSCDGHDRPQNWEGSEKLGRRIARQGWAPLRLAAGGEVFGVLSALLTRFPGEWSVAAKNDALQMAFRGQSLLGFSAWE